MVHVMMTLAPEMSQELTKLPKRVKRETKETTLEI
jgi:hypothetical protein